MRKRGLASVVASALAALSAGAAQADHAPAYVVPGRSDVPVMINGLDASWGVVNGDWGLYRPGAVGVTVYPAPFVPQPPIYRPVPRYFPSLGAAPQVGRYEVNPPAHRPMPPQAQPFHQSWSAGSDMSAPVTDYAPTGPMFISPEVNVPGGYPDRRWPHRRR
jgi:hypothetical protein